MRSASGAAAPRNAQYGSMVRTSLSVHGRLMRKKALRLRRQAIDNAANQDAWAQHIAERSMLGVVDPHAGPHQAALPEVAPTADGNQTIKDRVSENKTNSQDAAFETWLSAQFRSRGGRTTAICIRHGRIAASCPPPRSTPAHRPEQRDIRLGLAEPVQPRGIVDRHDRPVL
jgi:hypothetical protein